MGGGDQTATQTQQGVSQQQYDPWIGQAQQALGQYAFGLNQDFLKPSPYAVAGHTPDHLKAFDSYRDVLDQYGPGGQGGDKFMDFLNRGLIGPDDFKEHLNPFLDTVGRGVLGDMRREYANTDAALGARYAARGGLGGSGEALARGRLARGHNEQVPKVIGQLLSGGYDRAQGIAAQNAQNALAQAGLYNNFMSQDLARQHQAIGGVLGAGDRIQALRQAELNAPHLALDRIASMIPQVYGSQSMQQSSGTSSQPSNAPSPFQQILGLGLSAFGGGNNPLSGLFGG